MLNRFFRQVSAAPFERWTYADCLSALKYEMPENYHIAYDYAKRGDHYRRGKEWIGPGIAGATGDIKDRFASDDAIGEGLTNVRNAFREAQIPLTPLNPPESGQPVPEEVQNRIGELRSLLSVWWDKRRMHDHVQSRIHDSAWAGRSALRSWIPARFLETNRLVTRTRLVASFEDAFDAIHVSAPAPLEGGIVVHEDTQDACFIYLDKEVKWINGSREERPRAEMIFLDPARVRDRDASTIVRVVYADELTPRRATMQLGGNLLGAEMRSRQLISDSVLSAQRQLNFIWTIINRMIEAAGFRERYLGNVRPRGTKRKYEEGMVLAADDFLDIDDNQEIWVVTPIPRTLGSATTTELVGLPTTSGTNGEGRAYETPVIHIEDPVSPKDYIELAEAVRRRLMRMMSQAHLAMTSTAEASGFAYEQSRAGFEKDLEARRVSEEGMLREFLVAVVKLAELIRGMPGYFTDVIRIGVNQYVDAGPRSPDTVRLEMEANEKGLLSDETVMTRMGVEDTDIEMGQLRASMSYRLRWIEKAIELSQTAEWPSIAESFEKLGCPPEIVGAIAELVDKQPTPVEGKAGENDKGSTKTSEDARATGG